MKKILVGLAVLFLIACGGGQTEYIVITATPVYQQAQDIIDYEQSMHKLDDAMDIIADPNSTWKETCDALGTMISINRSLGVSDITMIQAMIEGSMASTYGEVVDGLEYECGTSFGFR